MNPARSVRTAIVGGALLLIGLPLLLLTISYGYEQWILHRYEARLTGLAEQVERSGAAPSWDEARRLGVEVRLLDARGAVEVDSCTNDAAVESSLFGGTAERWLERALGSEPPERLAEVDAALGSLEQRDEVRAALSGQPAGRMRVSASGQTVAYAVAVPRRGGGAIYVMKGSHRGIRRLLALRHQLLWLALFQLLAGLLLTGLLIRRVVRPIERLAEAARRYPAQPLAEPALLGRRDELGAVARAMTALADELERRRRETADVGADVAHEFKNPLATIAASAELIGATRDASDEKRRLVAEHIGANVERLRRSIDALLALLRLEAVLPDEPRREVDYQALVARLFDEYRRDPRWSEVRFEAEIAVATLRVNEARWSELLRNLIDNALEQPARDRRVVVCVEQTRDGVVTSVRDFGPGVSPGNRDKIFRRFFTQRPEGAPPGTGLGLSIVQAIAAAHGATVALESPTDGGARFRVVLPG